MFFDSILIIVWWITQVSIPQFISYDWPIFVINLVWIFFLSVAYKEILYHEFWLLKYNVYLYQILWKLNIDSDFINKYLKIQKIEFFCIFKYLLMCYLCYLWLCIFLWILVFFYFIEVQVVLIFLTYIFTFVVKLVIILRFFKSIIINNF